MEPADVWQSRLPKKYLDTGPRIVRAPLKEISFLGGRFRPVMGAPGDEGPLGDWWLYEELQRPLTRLDTAVGYSRDEIKLEVITYEQMRPGSYDVPQRLATTAPAGTLVVTDDREIRESVSRSGAGSTNLAPRAAPRPATPPAPRPTGTWVKEDDLAPPRRDSKKGNGRRAPRKRNRPPEDLRW